MTQNTAQHTPGPWLAKKASPQAAIITAPNRGLGIAEVFGGGQTHIANAALIAAAPDMLEALKLAAELVRLARPYFPRTIKNSDTFKLENTNAAINTAIAKATQA